MKTFMDKDFLLQSDAAKTLYHDYAENMPILDRSQKILGFFCYNIIMTFSGRSCFQQVIVVRRVDIVPTTFEELVVKM